MISAAIIREAHESRVMAGDPVTPLNFAQREACLYAAAMLRKRGKLPEDAHGYSARYVAESRVVTFSKFGLFDQAYRIPDRVLDFVPSVTVSKVTDDAD